MRLHSALLSLATTAMLPAVNAQAPLWNGIETGQAADAVRQRVFVDARGGSHIPSPNARIANFYLQQNNPAYVRIVYRGKPKQVCGVNIEGARATLEEEALLAELGPPASRITEELLNAPGGSAALLSGGKAFQILTWHRGPTFITFEKRIRPGYFALLYRGTNSAGSKLDC
jgi:hypothetical protein